MKSLIISNTSFVFDQFELPDLQVKRWIPKQVLFTAESLKYQFAQSIYERIKNLGIKIIETSSNRITGIKGKTDAETYRNAKSTLAIVKSPDSMKKLQPIPPSADYQFHLATGCPAHCQYCYLAGSLQGLPIVKAYGDLDDILINSQLYDLDKKIVSYEVSCYTDPLGLEHLTGSLSKTIQHFSFRNAHLRFVTKFDDVDSLLRIDHKGHTRSRFSVNAGNVVSRFEPGAATLLQRLEAARKMSSAESNLFKPYPLGIVLAPIIAFPGWEENYELLFKLLHSYLNQNQDITFEFITHRYTEKSKEILENWYPASQLPMDMDQRVMKFNKFGGVKYVYQNTLMKDLKKFFLQKTEQYFPQGKVLYWT